MKTSFVARRLAVAVIAAAVLGTGILPPLASPADAVVVCKRKKKIRLRDTSCKKKEELLVDLSSFVTDTGAEVGNLVGRVESTEQGLTEANERLDRVDVEFGYECTGDPSRTLALCEGSGRGGPRGLGPGGCYNDEGGCDGPCRQFDGDPTACGTAYQPSYGGGESCVYLDGLCVGCRDCGQRVARCFDTCSPPVMCRDAARTRFMGGPNTAACRRLTTQNECNTAWAHQNEDDPVSCYWDGSDCRGCGRQNERDGNCTNSCRTAPTCADAGRTLDSCFNQNEMDCDATYDEYGNGTAISCFWNTARDECETCDTRDMLAGDCTNECEPS